jgi:stage II sporulation protein D
MAKPSTMRRIIGFMKRPESMLATAALGLAGAVSVLVMVSMASCQYDGTDDSSTTSRDKPRTSGHASKPEKKPTTGAPTTQSTIRVAGEPELRVRILTNIESLKVHAPGGVLIAAGDPKGQTSDPAQLPGGSLAGWAGAEKVNAPIVAALRDTGWTWAGTGIVPSRRTTPEIPVTMALLIAPAVPGQLLNVNGAPFPGILRLTARPRPSASISNDGPLAFDAIEFVPLEEYLTGVVAKEMLSNWPLGAYQAQSVAARTYALHERERSINAGLAFDLESSDRDQVYSGATTNRLAIQAVNSTRGTVLMDNDRVLRAYFSSTCGGRTASARDTWPIGPGFEYNLAEPIQSHPRESLCNQSPLYRWTVERPRKELVQRFKTFGERNGLMIRQITELKAIEPMNATPGGRPNRYKIIQPDGKWFQLSGEEIRLACNTNVSGNAVLPTGGAPATAAPEGAGKGRGSSSSKGKPAPSAIVDSRTRETPQAPVLAAITTTQSPDAPGTLGAFTPIPDIDRKSRVNSSDFEVKVNGDKVVFTGRGFGHGVGLCQYCAKAMAERGDDWSVMMARFYPGAKIVKLY